MAHEFEAWGAATRAGRIALAVATAALALGGASQASAAWPTHLRTSGLAGLVSGGRWHATGFDVHEPLSPAFTSVEPWAPPSAPVGAGPSGIVAEDRTHTVYVVNQTDDSVSVIDAHACNVNHLAGCAQPVATISLGPGGLQNGPISALVSHDGRTLYVTQPDGANEVAVVDASTCNATDIAGCSTGPLATVATGNVPLDLAEDPGRHTLYVTNIADNTVSVVDTSHCNAKRIDGCGRTAQTVAVGNAPVALANDSQRRSLYVANAGDNTVSVIDTKACNAERPAGCASVPAVQSVGGAPNAVTTSGNGQTVYVANSGNGPNGLVADGSTVSLIDATKCNSQHSQGCSTVPAPVVGVGGQQDSQPQSVAFDRATHNVYVANSQDDSVSLVDTHRCTRRNQAGCPQTAPNLQSGGGPTALAVLSSVHTVYVADQTDGAVALLDDRTCTHHDPAGCRPVAAASTAVNRYAQLATGAAVDAADHTAYVIDYGVSFAGPFVLDLIDTNTCSASTGPGCVSPAPSFAPSSNPDGVAIDAATDTMYVSEGGPGPFQLEVIAAHRCNVANQTGCASRSIIPLGQDDSGGLVLIDDATHTGYVLGVSAIAVIDLRHCNATDTSGCPSQPVGQIMTGQPAFNGAIAPDTLYAASAPGFDLSGTGYLEVIDTRHCRAADTSGCSTLTPANVTVGKGPTDVAVDPVHHTAYIPDNANGDSQGLLAMVNTTHCSGDDTTNCSSQTPATTPTGRSPLVDRLDPATGTLYVTNFSDASVFTYDAGTCNAVTQTGCPAKPPEVITGTGPDDLALDPANHTIYVPNFFDGTVSLLSTGP